MITPLPNSRHLRIPLQKNVALQGIVTPNFHTILNIIAVPLVMILLLVIQIVVTGVQQALIKHMLIKFILKQYLTITILELNQIGNTSALVCKMSDKG